MIDGRNLNILQNGRQMLRAFGGVNETYGCSEAELSSSLNFSARGYPALQTRAKRRKVRTVKDVNGMYHLNGLVLCRGTTLEYTPDERESREGTVVLENALTDIEKTMTGMGTKVLIWPDKKAFDIETGELTDLAAVWELGGGQMTVTPCDGEGKTYTPDSVGTEEPESPADGQLFLKGEAEEPYGAASVLMKYSAKNKKWTEILLQDVRIHCPGLGSVMKEGDTVTVSGMPQEVCDALAAGLDGEVSIGTLDGDDVIATLTPQQESSRYYGSWTVTATSATWQSADGKVSENRAVNAPVKLERRVPDLDFVTEQGNRVWGCSRKENSIYACALGDPTNWYSYRGIASDSYAVSVGSDGAFTGAASCLGYVLFFKEHCIHKLYGTKPSDYQMSSVRCRGVAANAAKSLCVIAETLYYLSPDGVMAWSGSLPSKVSGALDTGKLTAVDRAVGGQLDARYYLYLHRKTEDGGRLLVYDTERGVWQEESTAGTGMVSTGQQLYLWDGSALWAADPEREAGGEDETELKFEAVTGDIGLAVPDDKYISRVTLRMDALAHTVLTVAVSYDGGDWETVSSCAVTKDHQRVNLPFVPRRHDTMRLKFAGTGQMALRSMAFTFADATGARVSGAVPGR
nr:MAG TPA: stabilization protein [Caudoviricetes sp.]